MSTDRMSPMPRTNLGRNLPGMALAGLLAFLAGCASSAMPPTAWTKPHNVQDDASLPPQGNTYPASGNYCAKCRTGLPGRAASGAAQRNYPQANYGYPQPSTYTPAAPAGCRRRRRATAGQQPGRRPIAPRQRRPRVISIPTWCPPAAAWQLPGSDAIGADDDQSDFRVAEVG